jgi:hypothetical protein
MRSQQLDAGREIAFVRRQYGCIHAGRGIHEREVFREEAFSRVLQ